MKNNFVHIQKKLSSVSQNGGKVELDVKEYFLNEPITVYSSCVKLCGKIWNYPNDPNGVFESFNGTKLKLAKDVAGIFIGKDRDIGGIVVSDIGIQGSILGMDTRKVFDFNDLNKNAGLVFSDTRVDQADFNKISFTGLSVGVLVTGNAELDANHFLKMNFDGCYMGIYFSPRASYYTKIDNCIIADTPSYGLYVDGTRSQMHNLEICDSKFVRNCGANTHSSDNASIYLKNTDKCLIRNCLIDDSGTFWYYADGAVSNDERQPSHVKSVGIKIKGNFNRIISNTVDNSTHTSIYVEGDNNVLMNNVVDKDVVIKGSFNKINGLVFTDKNARLILKGDAVSTTEIIGVIEDKIIKQP